ncbi:hypothetical protein NM3222_1977 [Neisseria meningitidis NM3222]|nr:hypothetical protein NM3222_1977 [Neisseria meningitidis NM3222]
MSTFFTNRQAMIAKHITVSPIEVGQVLIGTNRTIPEPSKKPLP